MKTIKLISLSLNNFKGIKQFTLNADSQDIKVFGDNATGKTTVFDGFIWLLFDKDSQNNSTNNFAIKTLKDGQVLHNLDHEVEAMFLVDNKQLSLKKVYAEKWTKKRGSVNKEFAGHTTDHFINNVPSKKKEFTEAVAEIVDEGVFKLLTSPSYFNEQMHWKDRRSLLLEIAGDVTDNEVISSDKKLEKLTEVLNGNSIEDHKKIIAAKRKEINQELDRIPIRIDEIHKGLPDTDGLNKVQIEQELNHVAQQIDEKQDQINDIRGGSEINKIKAEISDIDLQISKVKNEHAQQGQEQLYKLKAKLQEERSNASHFESKIGNAKSQKDMNNDRIRDSEQQMQDLREQWKSQNEQEFDHDNNCSCPTCGQDLPEEQKEEAKANFNRNKSSLLEKIQSKGTDLKAKVEAIKEDNERIDAEIEKYQAQLDQKKKAIEKLDHDAREAELNVQPIEENQKYQVLIEQKNALNNKINELQQSVEQSVAEVRNQIESLKEQQNELNIDMSKLTQVEQSHKRIAELEQQEEKLAAEYDQLEEELYLTEEFIRTKVDMLNDKINSKFKHARFNLFKTNINGGLEEICDTTYKGIPYSSGLNNAARINVGLDIIATLSEHYGVQAPIFVDNAEAVTQLLDIDAQLISLVVSEQDKQLRVEAKSESEVA